MDVAKPDASDSGISAARRARWKQRLIHEVKRFLLMFLYLWAMYGLFLLHESVVLARYHIPFTRYGYALVTALVLAKVMLIMEDLNIARGFKGKPLIYPILYKSVVYAVVFLAFYVAEETIGGLLRGETMSQSMPSIAGGTPQGYAIALVFVTLALVPYFAFQEIGRAIGADELRELLFKRKPRIGVTPSAHQA